MPIKQTTYICDVCGEQFTSKREFEAHKCKASETLYCASLHDCVGSEWPYVKVMCGHFTNRKGQMVFMSDKDGTYPVHMQKGQDLLKTVFLKSYEGLDSEFEDRMTGSIDTLAMFFGNANDLADIVAKLYDAQMKYNLKKAEEDCGVIEGHVAKDKAVRKEVGKMGRFVAGNIEHIVRLADEWKTVEMRTDEKDWTRINYTDSKNEYGCIFVGRNAAKNVAKEAPKTEQYKDKDLFLMRIDINWADEIDFESTAVVTGKERRALEERAARADTCRIGFGTNEDGEYDDIMRHVEFTAITKKERDTLDRLGMLQVGSIGYDTIMEGLSGEEIDDDDDEYNKKNP